MAEYSAPHAHEALHKILKSMSVEKGGKLPANMGGKSYITASDLSAEAKRQFVENDLILVPSEKVIRYEAINGTRLQILVAVEGTYEVISRKDGSSVTFSGVGDGVATGSAVASNIASTNALKNALLRLFMVTEQSVEDQAKNGVEGDTATSPGASKVAKAANASAPKAVATGGKSEVPALQAEIKSFAATTAEKVGVEPNYYQAVGKRMFPDAGVKWMTDGPSLSKLLTELKGGAVE